MADTSGNLSRLRITILKDGPYVVSGGVPLIRAIIVSDERGDPINWSTEQVPVAMDPYRLCRCGQSKSWPLCDGTHHRADFDGSETDTGGPYLERAELFEGPDLKLTDVAVLCANAAFCDREGGTWHLTEKSDDPFARRLAVEQAGNCPSGRLVAWDRDGVALEPELPPSIGLVENPLTAARGPLWVRGRITIVSASGASYEPRNRVTLCGCGHSRNKPFCDGAHFKR